MLLYTYDYGDSWEHEIRVGKQRPAKQGIIYPQLISAERRCPPENIGGPWGYGDLLDALAEREAGVHRCDDDDEDIFRTYYDGAYDPDDLNIDQITRGLARSAKILTEWPRLSTQSPTGLHCPTCRCETPFCWIWQNQNFPHRQTCSIHRTGSCPVRWCKRLALYAASGG